MKIEKAETSKIHADAALSFFRAAFSSFLAASGKGQGSAEATARKRFAADEAAALILQKASTPGATTGDSAWAGLLAAQSAGAFFSTLPQSAAARLISAGTLVNLDGSREIRFPIRATAATGLPWVGEAGSIPVRQYDLSNSVALGPAKKVAVIVTASRDLAARSAAPAIFRTLLSEEAVLALDAAIFNSNAATADSPAGLFNGLTPLAAASAGDGALDADLAALAASVAAGGGRNFAFVAAPGQAAAIAIRRPDLTFPVWASAALAAGTVAAVDPSSFVSGFGSQPEISAGAESTLHMDDTAPEHIGQTGSPNVVAAPVKNLFQTGEIATRAIVDAAFVLRAPDARALMNGVNW